MAWLILHFPGTYWNFYFAKAKLHHDGAVTFTGFCYVMKDRVLWEGNIRQLSRLLLCNQL